MPIMSVPKNRLKYDPALIDVRQSPEGPLHLGTKIVEVRSMMGRKGEMVTEVSELEPNHLIGYRTLAGDPTNAFGAYQFESVPEGTKLYFEFYLGPQGDCETGRALCGQRHEAGYCSGSAKDQGNTGKGIRKSNINFIRRCGLFGQPDCP